MNLLLDTCSILWGLQEPKRLSSPARKALEDPEHRILVSSVSFWEISLKYALGKLEMEGAEPGDFPEFVEAQGWEILPLEGSTAAGFNRIPKRKNHKDPFDRMLVWIAMESNLCLVSRDHAMQEYEAEGLKILW